MADDDNDGGDRGSDSSIDSGASEGRVRRFPLYQARIREYYATARRVAAERVAAPGLLDDVLRRTPREDWATLAERPELMTSGVIERLSTILSAELTRDPARALDLATLGVSLAEAIAHGEYHRVTEAQIRAGAWKEYGKVLSYLARHQEAFDAFRRAEAHIDALGNATLGFERALIQVNRAMSAQELGRFDESIAILRECKEVFREHDDEAMFVLSTYYEGAAFQRAHRYRDAREIYLLLIATATRIQTDMLAALHQTIGLCSIELRDYSAAEDNLRKSLALNKQLGLTVNVVKVEYARGILLNRRGLAAEAVDHLRPVRHRFLKHSLAEEAGLCGLEMVEGMLALGDHVAAEALARTIVNEFLAAALNARAITALGLLSEAIAERKAKPRAARAVREYVLSLRSTPEREFTPQLLYRTRGGDR